MKDSKEALCIQTFDGEPMLKVTLGISSYESSFNISARVSGTKPSMLLVWSLDAWMQRFIVIGRIGTKTVMVAW